MNVNELNELLKKIPAKNRAMNILIAVKPVEDIKLSYVIVEDNGVIRVPFIGEEDEVNSILMVIPDGESKMQRVVSEDVTADKVGDVEKCDIE